MAEKTEAPEALHSRFIKGGGIYALGSVIESGLSFLLLPLITAYLSVEDFGVIGIVAALATFAAAVMQHPFSAGFRRFYFREDQIEQRETRLFLGFLLILGQASLLAAALYLGCDLWADLLLADSKYGFVFQIYAGILVFLPCQHLTQALLRIQNRATLFVSVNIARLLTYVALVLYLLVVRDMGLMGLLLGYLYRAAFDVVVLLPYLIRNLRFSLDFKRIKPCLEYGYPLVLAIAAFILMTSCDRVILRYFDPTLTWSGLYSFGAKFGTIVALSLNVPLKYVLNPLIFEYEEKTELLKGFLASLTLLYFRVGVVVAVAISLFSKEIVLVVARDRSYDAAWAVIPLLCMTYVFDGLRDLFGKGLGLANRTLQIGKNIFSALLLNVMLNFALIPFVGIYGAAVASMLAYMFLAWLNYHTSKSDYPITYRFPLFFGIGGLAFIAGVGSVVLNVVTLDFYLTLICKLVFLVSVVVVTYKSLSSDEMNMLRKFTAKNKHVVS